MSLSQIDIKIGCNGTQKQENYTELLLSITLHESKINQYNNYIQKQLNVKKTPILSIQLTSNQIIQTPINVQLFGNQFQLKMKGQGSKKILWGDIKNQNKLLLFRKIERLFHLLTQLNIDLKVKCSVYEFEGKNKKIKPELEDLLEAIKIKGTLKMDEKGPETLKKCLIKVSPKFIQSPIFVFYELFTALNCKLDLQNLDQLDPESKKHLLPTIFKLNNHNEKLFEIFKKSGKQAKLTLCLQKLISLQLLGPSELIGAFCLYL